MQCYLHGEANPTFKEMSDNRQRYAGIKTCETTTTTTTSCVDSIEVKGPNFNLGGTSERADPDEGWPMRDVATVDDCKEECLDMKTCTGFHYYSEEDDYPMQCYLHGEANPTFKEMSDNRQRYAGIKTCETTTTTTTVVLNWATK